MNKEPIKLEKENNNDQNSNEKLSLIYKLHFEIVTITLFTFSFLESYYINMVFKGTSEAILVQGKAIDGSEIRIEVPANQEKPWKYGPVEADQLPQPLILNAVTHLLSVPAKIDGQMTYSAVFTENQFATATYVQVGEAGKECKVSK